MLEILLLFWLGKKLGAIARDKGRSAIGYRFMLVGLWIAGEIGGLIAGMLISRNAGASGGQVDTTAYLFALMGAAAGAIVSFVIVNALPSLRHESGPRGFAVNPMGPYQPPPGS